MNIDYVNRSSVETADIEKMSVLIDGSRILVPQTTVAYVEGIKNSELFNYEYGIASIQRTIRALINRPELDDAVHVAVSYKGTSFENSVHYREGIVFGKLWF